MSMGFVHSQRTIQVWVASETTRFSYYWVSVLNFSSCFIFGGGWQRSSPPVRWLRVASLGGLWQMWDGCWWNGPAPLSPQWLTISVFHGTCSSQFQAALFYIYDFFLKNHPFNKFSHCLFLSFDRWEGRTVLGLAVESTLRLLKVEEQP